MRVKTFIFWIIVVIVCIVVYIQFFGEGFEDNMPITTTGNIELKIVNATSSQADFYIDGAPYRIFAEKSKYIENIPIGKHEYSCYYVDNQWQNINESGNFNVQTNLTITISPKMGVIW